MTQVGLFRFSRHIALLGITLASMFAAQNSFARAEVYLQATGSPALGGAMYHGLEVAEVSKTVTQKNGPGYASGTGQLNTGTLRASAFGFDGYGATSNVYIGDNVIFSGGIGQVGYLDYYVHGSITNPAPVDSRLGTYGGATFGINIGNFHHFSGFGLAPNAATCASHAQGGIIDCRISDTLLAQGTIPFTIMDKYGGFGFSINASADDGYTTDFGNTAKLFIRLPDGVTMKSSSGVFLADAKPVLAAVPEPETYAMLFAGLGVLGFVARRNRKAS